MTLLFLVIVGLAFVAVVTALAWRWTRTSGSPARDTARKAGAAIRRHRGVSAALVARLDPRAATGLVLTLAVAVIVGGGVLLGVLAYLVRDNGDLQGVDPSVADWGQRHGSAFGHDGLELISHLGEPRVIVTLAAVLAVVETVRTRSRWVAPFLALVVAGNGVLTTTIKELAQRVRPTIDPIAETLGPSFPSGHSSWSAAFFAAAALVLSRGRPPAARALLAGLAAGLAVTIAGSRVLLGVHWLSDVLAGLALGSAWFAACAIAFGGRLLQFGAPAEEAVREARGAGARRVARSPAD